MDEKEYFFSEWVHIFSDDDIEQAHLYLKLWKMFFLRKLHCHTLINEQVIEREKTECTPRTLGIKIQVKAHILEEDKDEN